MSRSPAHRLLHGAPARLRARSERGLAALAAAVVLVAAIPAGAAAARPESGGSPPAETELPSSASDILFVGDSVTAGVWFMSLGDRSAAQAWPAQLLARLDLPAVGPRLPRPYPLDFWALTTRGFGLGGWRFPWSALPILKPRRPRFAADEPRTVVAVPGQTVKDVLDQSSGRSKRPSSGGVFRALLLPRGRTAVETAEAGARSPHWIVLFVGANDLLAGLGIVQGLDAPQPEEFSRDYEEIAVRLRAVMAPTSTPDRLIVFTLPDVTELPLLQEVPSGAVDARGRRLPAGTKASAFLLAFRNDRFDTTECLTPAQLRSMRERAEAYNGAIRTIAAKHGFTVFELPALLAELAADPAFATVASPHFSPDLHHPSALTHARIAEGVAKTMQRVGGFDETGSPGSASPPPAALPSAAELDPVQRARAAALLRVTLLGMSTGEFPPRPSWRAAVEAAAHAGGARRADGSVALLLALESSPGPVGGRWVSRGTLAVRGAAAVDGEDALRVPRDAVDLRAGLGFERLGEWRWSRIEGGLRWDRADRLGLYARGEWRAVFAEARSDGVEPDEVVAGIRWGAVRGRPGRNGN